MTTLSDLRGRASAIFTGALFHLFTYEQQQQLAHQLAGLLSPLPGSMLFGVQGGRPVKGPWGPGVDFKMHSHSPESWREMWEEIFAEVGCKVEVEGRLRREVGGETFFGMWPENVEGYYVLEWSVTRI